MDKIGFIGLGIMGRPMVHNLLKAGFEVTVYNRSQPPIEEMVAAGAKAAASPRAIATQSEVIITMVTASEDVTAVLAGEQGVFETIKPGQVIIDMSTISPITTRQLAQRAAELGASMLDAPVSGGDKGAIGGTLSIMVGGDEAAFERCLPLFQAIGQTIVHIGPSGTGQIVKACNQIATAVNLMGLAEALVLGSKAGVDPHKVLQVLSGGLANSRVLELRGASMLEHNFTPGGKLALHSKDLGIVTTLARSVGVPLPATSLVAQAFLALEQAGHSELDHSAILLYLEELARHKIGE